MVGESRLVSVDLPNCGATRRNHWGGLSAAQKQKRKMKSSNAGADKPFERVVLWSCLAGRRQRLRVTVAATRDAMSRRAHPLKP